MSSLTLRTKLMLLILGITCSLVITLIVLSLDAVRRASDTAQEISGDALETQASSYMIEVTEQNAARNAGILERTLSEAQLLAEVASALFSQPDAYASVSALDEIENVVSGPEGQHFAVIDSNVSLFVPNWVEIDAEIEQVLLLSRLLDPIALKVLKEDPNAAMIYLSTRHEVTRFYPPVGLHVLPGDFKITDHFLYTDSDPIANPERKTTWTPVYDDPTGKGLLVSVIAPVYTAGDEFVGITGIDFKLGDLAQTIEQSSLLKESFSFLVDANGRAIAFPDRAYTDLLGRPRESGEFGTDLSPSAGTFGNVIQAMRLGQTGVQHLTGEHDSLIAYSSIRGTGWSLATVVDTEVILREIMSLESTLTEGTAHFAMTRFIPMSLAILVVVTAMAFFLAYRFTAPLRRLTEAAENIGKQQWETPLPKPGNDEVGLLSRTLGNMAGQLGDLIGRLELRVSERTQDLSAALEDLECSNQQLFDEMEERKRSDAVRADMEARFRQAYQNAPIGMALVGRAGDVFNANPNMKALFWPDADAEDHAPLKQVVIESDSERFAAFMETLQSTHHASSSEEFTCVTHEGELRRMVFQFSPVEDADGDVGYLVLLAQDVTDNYELTEQLQHQANFDELTGLMNRRAFSRCLEQHWESVDTNEVPAYLMFLDLDQFKVVNDTCGHAAGDKLLINVSEILTSSVRSSDHVARLGGDEFGILVSQCSPEVALERAESIRRAVQDLQFFWESEVFRIGVSIGMVNVNSEIPDLGELQQIADAACYAAKEAGRNRVHVVSGDKDAALGHRSDMRWVQRLNDAMDNNRFALYGQRIRPLNTDSNEPEHLEILLRLRDIESRTLIPPGAFLPAAERYGLIVELDKWVITNLLKSLKLFHDAQSLGQRYWVNLSGASLGDPEFSSLLTGLIRNSNLPPGTVNFEITETVVIRSMGDASRLIADLQSMGCEIALDDFGSGLSSFTYLKTLNVDYLKIDGSFVKNIVDDEVDQIFLKSIVDIAAKLGIKTIAEFVENDAILDRVKALGVDYAQGFGIHRPETLLARFPKPVTFRSIGEMTVVNPEQTDTRARRA